MFGKNRITLDRDLFDRVRAASAKAGYASSDEFVAHVLERELSRTEEGPAGGDVKKQLEGLGYIS